MYISEEFSGLVVIIIDLLNRNSSFYVTVCVLKENLCSLTTTFSSFSVANPHFQRFAFDLKISCTVFETMPID